MENEGTKAEKSGSVAEKVKKSNLIKQKTNRSVRDGKELRTTKINVRTAMDDRT